MLVYEVCEYCSALSNNAATATKCTTSCKINNEDINVDKNIYIYIHIYTFIIVGATLKLSYHVLFSLIHRVIL